MLLKFNNFNLNHYPLEKASHEETKTRVERTFKQKPQKFVETITHTCRLTFAPNRLSDRKHFIMFSTKKKNCDDGVLWGNSLNPCRVSHISKIYSPVRGLHFWHSHVNIVLPLQLNSLCCCLCLHLGFNNTAIDGTHKYRGNLYFLRSLINATFGYRVSRVRHRCVRAVLHYKNLPLTLPSLYSTISVY